MVHKVKVAANWMLAYIVKQKYFYLNTVHVILIKVSELPQDTRGTNFQTRVHTQLTHYSWWQDTEGRWSHQQDTLGDN